MDALVRKLGSEQAKYNLIEFLNILAFGGKKPDSKSRSHVLSLLDVSAACARRVWAPNSYPEDRLQRVHTAEGWSAVGAFSFFSNWLFSAIHAMLRYTVQAPNMLNKPLRLVTFKHGE